MDINEVLTKYGIEPPARLPVKATITIPAPPPSRAGHSRTTPLDYNPAGGGSC